MASQFAELSKALTGATTVADDRAKTYEDRLRYYFGSSVDDLFKAFEAASQSGTVDPETAARNALADEPKLHRLAREIIRLWYLGEFQTPVDDVEPPHSTSEYEEGMLWSVIRAHAPAFTDSGYGAWATPPK